MKEITIKVDTNDGDYIQEAIKIDEDILNSLLPLINAIKRCKSEFNFGYGEASQEDVFVKYGDFPKDIIETFLECCPSSEYGFHSIKSIVVKPYVEGEKLL